MDPLSLPSCSFASPAAQTAAIDASAPVPKTRAAAEEDETPQLGDTRLVDWRISLRDLSPTEILMNPSMTRALESCDISMFEAFDALVLYYDCGVESITVAEFSEACRRVSHSPTGRQLMRLDIRVDRRFNELQRCIHRTQRTVAMVSHAVHSLLKADAEEIAKCEARAKQEQGVKTTTQLVCSGSSGPQTSAGRVN
eukprot:GHVT01020750.1.p1 GENE.GHVT01020750.1~~GHVT01020750.1.p1  ORF type:complete len:197 (+),score=42.67 GHVT01020750.1:3-593(+)